jgi:hypothetical protein
VGKAVQFVVLFGVASLATAQSIFRRDKKVRGGALLILLLSAGFLYGQKTAKSVLRPPVGKLDTKTCPVLHIDQPTFPLTLNTIAGVLGTALKVGDRFSPVDYQMNNAVYLPEGTYDLAFGWARHFSGPPIPCSGDGSCERMQSSSTGTTISLDAPMDQLRLRVEAKNGRHYYLFAPRNSVVAQGAAVQYAPAGTSFDHMYGVLKVCGFSSDHVLTPEEETTAQQSPSVTCDAQTPPHAKGMHQAPPVIQAVTNSR